MQLRRTARGAQSWSLVVEDQGTADSTQAATPVPERPGTGLGLDIVRRTAARAGGNAAVGRTPGGGFRVEVHVPDNAAQTAPTPSPGDEPPPPSRARPASTAAVTYRRAVLRSTPACAAAVRSPAPASHARCTSRISVTAASRNAIPRTPKSIDLKAPGTGSDQDPQAGTPGGPITATGWSHARARKSTERSHARGRRQSRILRPLGGSDLPMHLTLTNTPHSAPGRYRCWQDRPGGHGLSLTGALLAGDTHPHPGRIPCTRARRPPRIPAGSFRTLPRRA